MPITVLSKDPASTRLTYRVRAVSRTAFFTWRMAMSRARLYINGGGSLIQDVTSRRSLWFYLMNIRRPNGPDAGYRCTAAGSVP